MSTANILVDLFNNILRGIAAINDCLGLACKQTILQSLVSRSGIYHQPQFIFQVAV